jgi:sec-independent protein translocase protein TatA
MGATIGTFLEKGEQMPNIGPLEIILVLIVALIVFGPKRLPELGRSMGKGIREFRGSLSGDKDDDDDVREIESAKRETAAREEEVPLEGEVVHDRRS